MGVTRVPLAILISQAAGAIGGAWKQLPEAIIDSLPSASSCLLLEENEFSYKQGNLNLNSRCLDYMLQGLSEYNYSLLDLMRYILIDITEYHNEGERAR